MRAAATWGLMIGLSGLAAPAWAAPPVEPVGEAPLAPDTVVEPDTVAEPVPVPESEPSPGPQLPAYDAPLPTYDEVPIGPDAPFDDAPPIETADPSTGRGRTAVGSIFLGGGVALLGASMAFTLQGTDLAVWIPGAVIGSSAAVIGAVFVATGHLRQQKYRAWAKTHANAPVPARGDGMVASGLTCIIAGTMGSMIGGASIVLFQTEDDPPYGQVLAPLGAVSVVTGVGLLAAGSVRRKQFETWKADQVVPSLSLLPGTRQSIGGLSLGLAGRF